MLFDDFVVRLVPDQAGVLWIGALVMLVVFGDFNRLISRRNLYLLGLLVLAPLLVDITEYSIDSTKARVGHTALFLVTGGYAVWGIYLTLRVPRTEWRPNLSTRALQILLGVVLIYNTAVIFGRPPNDAGYFTNLGAERWVETGRLPYGDPLLRGPDSPGHGAASTYGPILYMAHVPFQLLLGAERNPPEAVPVDRTSYVRPPNLASQLAAYLFYLGGLVAIFGVVRRTADLHLALAVVVVFAALPYVAGVGGRRETIGGLTYISHLAPTALLLLALLAAAARRPIASGALGAAAAGALFWPVFVFPAWLGWFLSQGWSKAARFVGGAAAVGAVLTAVIVVFTPAPDPVSALGAFVESVVEHQEGTEGSEYGASAFGFWGQNPAIAEVLHQPLWSDSPFTKPSFMFFAVLVVASFFMARGRSVPQLAGLTAALAAAVQMWKTHGTGTYNLWFMPFLMIAIFAARRVPAAEDRAAEAERIPDYLVPSGG